MILHLISTEQYLIDMEVTKILDNLNINKKDLNYLEPKSMNDLENFTETYSLFSNQKIAIIKNIEDEKLIPIFENLSDDITILLINTLDKRKKLYKWLSKNKKLKDISTYNKSNLIKWIQELGIEFNSKITISNANEILDRTGENDMYNIKQEVLKLCCMKEKITSTLINCVISKSSLVVSFDLTNSILKKDLSKSLKILNELIEKNEQMIPIVALLNKNFSVIKSLKQVNDTVLKESGIDFFTIKNLRPYSKDNTFYTQKELEKYIDLTEKADFELKNGLDPKLIIEKLIISISMKGAE